MKKKIDLVTPVEVPTYNDNVTDLREKLVDKTDGRCWLSWPRTEQLQSCCPQQAMVFRNSYVSTRLSNVQRLEVISRGGKGDQLSFRRAVVRSYLQDRKILKLGLMTERSGSSLLPPSKEALHLPKKLLKQLRCVVCHQRVRWQCATCNKTLCIERNCFEIHHKKWINSI